jgi:lysophospholipase L1-like esterase
MVLLVATAGAALATNLMPTGNSITDGNGSTSGLGYRDLLHTQLDAIGTFDFVGSSGTAPYQGHFQAGATIEEFYPGSFGAGHGTGTFSVESDMDGSQPEIVVIHLGTNDINSSQAPYAPWSDDHGASVASTASGELGDFIKYLLQWHDGTHGTFLDQIIVSRIIPLESHTADVEDFNREVVRMVLDFRNGAVTGSPEPVYLADHFLHFMSNPDLFSGGAGDWMDDSIHPNDAGYGEMADVFFDTVDEVLNDPGPPDAVTDLAVATENGRSALLVWTNTGDSGSTGDPRYADLRYSTSAIDATNFGTRDQAGDYQLVGAGGAVTGLRVTGLSNSTIYSYAMKLVDDAANLSPMSNVIQAETLADDDTWVDRFNRTLIGPDWNVDPGFSVNGTELVNGAASGGAEHMAIFRGAASPATVQFTWAASADSAGIDQAGIACRLEGTDPATADGYIVFRNVEPGQGAVLNRIVDGAVAGATIDLAPPGQPAPEPGDTFTVVLSSDAGGHHFSVYINDLLDAVLTDPDKLYGNGAYYAGYIGSGGLNDNIDDFRVVTVSTNLPPAVFALLAPPDQGLIPNLNPFFWWEEAIDPNPGDALTYNLYVSTTPGFTPSTTISTTGLSSTQWGLGELLDANETYYWRVQAEDPHGLTTWSSDVWELTIDNVQQFADGFERVALGPDWNADPGFSIVGGELACTTPGFDDIAVYTPISDVRGAAWTWSETAVQSELDYAGAVFLDGASPDSGGYYIFRKTIGSQKWSVFEIQNGLLTGSLSIDTSGRLPIPGPGDRMRVNYIATPAGNVFECYINDEFDARLVDYDRLQVNGSTVHTGMILGQNAANNVEDFVALGVHTILPPGPFHLLAPAHGDTGVAIEPVFAWEPASGAGTVYTVYVGTDSSFATADSMQLQTATSLAWPDSLELNTDYAWCVRASGADASLFNLLGWFRFRTTSITVPVELARFEASGEVGCVVLRWEAASEIDHLGYHVWRSLEADSGYERLTAELVRGASPYAYVDRTIERGRLYYYRLEAVDRAGGSQFFGPVRGQALTRPLRLALHQNVPNPFNPSTTIAFELDRDQRVRLVVFDVTGRTVRHLVDGPHEAGLHEVLWNGRSDTGAALGNGVYFYRLEAGDWSRTRKMLMVQ